MIHSKYPNLQYFLFHGSAKELHQVDPDTVKLIGGDLVHWALTSGMHAFVFMVVVGEHIRNQADATL